MPVIIGVPLEDILPVYEPIVFRLQTQVATTTFSAAIEVEVYVNGSALNITKLYDPVQVDDDGVFTTFTYEIDLSGKLQDAFDNDAAFLPLNYAGDRKSDALLFETYFRAYDWLPDATTGQRVRSAGYTQSQITHTLNAYRRADQTATVRDHWGANGFPFEFLTEKPSRVLVGLEDSEYISAISDSVYHWKIVTYDENGATVDTGYFSSSLVNVGETTILQTGIGPANINAVSSWFYGSATIDDTIKFYTVIGGVGCTDGTWTDVSVLRRYYVVDMSCREYRFHFLNNFGQHETFDVFNNSIEEYRVKSEHFEQTLPVDRLSSSRSRNRLVATGDATINCFAENLTPDEREWVRSFAMSTNIYLEKDDQLFAVVMNDSTFEYKNNRRALASVQFTLDFSIQDQSQRN